jgi:HK97 family phage major capsid protein
MNEIQKKMAKLFQEYEGIRLTAEKEGRRLTSADLEKRAKIKSEIDALEAQLDTYNQENELRVRLYGDGENRALTLIDPSGSMDYPLPATKNNDRRALGTAKGRKYRDLFGHDVGTDGWNSSRDFYDAVTSGKFHPNLRALTVGTPADGGFLVPTEYASEIHDVALESEIIFPRCTVVPMFSNEKKVPATEIGDHSQNLYGNMVAYWSSEGGTLQDKPPKFRDMTLNAKKLTVLFKFSNEWKDDVQGSENKLSSLAGNGLSWYRDKALLKGSGNKEPLGILNSDCLITVPKESGQSADTIIYTNLAKMVGRLHPACFQNSIWIIQVSAIPQLLELSIPIGTGGSAYPVLTESNGIWKILTRPVIFTEKTEKVGDKGDILLADLSQYICGLRKELRFETSNGPGFTTDEGYGRMIARLDGQPLWDEPLTLEDGSTTVSPFVTLADR